VRIWPISDVHLESSHGWDLPSGDARPSFDAMVLAGDLVPRMERGVKWLLERVPDRPVIYVPGNHEAYGTDIDRTLECQSAFDWAPPYCRMSECYPDGAIAQQHRS
jgi:hypothetical protein